MQFNISDQRPATLDPIHMLPIKGTYDPAPAMRETLVDPLFEPLPGRSVSITDDKGSSYNQDAILNLFMHTLSGTVNNRAEQGVKNLLAQGLINFELTSQLLVNEVFANQAGAASKLPTPGPRVIYSANSDVIPAAKALLSRPDETMAKSMFASLAFSYCPETLGFWFLTESAYDDFRQWFDQQVIVLSAVLPADTLNLLQKFQQLNLSGLTESLTLRKNDADQLHDYSFARVLVHLLMQYSRLQQNQAAATPGTLLESGVLPFVLTELFLPRTVVLVNTEAHARASAHKVDAEWRLINQSLNSPVKVVSASQLSKLTALSRALAKASSAAVQASTQRSQQIGRSAKIVFRKQAPTTVDIMVGLMRVLKQMKEVNRSQNIFRKVKTTFTKANRRDPQDFNKPGKSVSTHYLPDLHIYVDTSGSISESNYQHAIMMLIKLAKKLNVNLYFNSFSHIMSQEVLLKTAGKSTSQIWKEFQRIPKIAGGTNYEQIWQYINTSLARKRRLSLVITDFEWRARSHRVEHPKNLYYAPCSNMDWDRIVGHMRGFVESARHLDPAIAQHLIGVII
ncbi:MAG: hypothetical protein B5766_05360 [Candidatus Lumbricidophila eiseniae]|uniref:Uncharacterized protein n=1 Tax=Candidatus Lumbricidiphila eiseniae TaxID=1969409 RepID=A0A2A6FRI6_9MICO|nr:MAG: hypothetical protein B5766_05360 [Candidatus Lumbricidophila eiseniae]